MQQFVSNRSIGEVSIGRCEELSALRVDDDREFALTSSSAFILVWVEDYFDVDTRAFLHLKDELPDWLTKARKILWLHEADVARSQTARHYMTAATSPVMGECSVLPGRR